MGIELGLMTLAELFENHLRLAVRLQSGTSIREDSEDVPSAGGLATKLDVLERGDEFLEGRRLEGFHADAKYAVDALIDAIVDQSGSDPGWTRRNTDSFVGHHFYEKMDYHRGFQQQRKRATAGGLYPLRVFGICWTRTRQESRKSRDGLWTTNLPHLRQPALRSTGKTRCVRSTIVMY